MKTAKAPATYRRRQRVQITHAAGRVELATIVRPDRTMDGRYIVRFADDGHKLCVAASSIEAL